MKNGNNKNDKNDFNNIFPNFKRMRLTTLNENKQWKTTTQSGITCAVNDQKKDEKRNTQ